MARLTVLITVIAACAAGPGVPGVLWSSGFDDVAVGELPDGVLVLDGEWAVARDGDDRDNRVLKLAGEPVGEHGVMFGPRRVDGVWIAARMRGAKRGRRAPVFGVGLNGVDGHRLLVNPGRDALEIRRRGETVASVDYAWAPGKWTRLRLEVVRAGEGKWTVRGKAWADGEDEPGEWLVVHEVEAEPMNGSATVWGMAYSGEAIGVDGVVYGEVE